MTTYQVMTLDRYFKREAPSSNDDLSSPPTRDEASPPTRDEGLSLKNSFKPIRKGRVHCTSRVEVLSMWFVAAKKDKESFINYIIYHRKYLQHVKEPFRNIIEKDPAMFIGRVFLCDCFDSHEIYNSKSVKTLYTDLPMAPTRKLEDCNISGHTDLLGTNEEQVQEDTTNGLKNNSNGNSVFSGDNEMLATNEEQVRQDTKVFSSLAPDVAQSQAPEKTFLPVMGPHVGILLSGDFVVAVHRDCGYALIDDLYTETVARSYMMRNAPPYDDCNAYCPIEDKRCQVRVEGLYHSLIMDCIIFRDSKSVNVEVEWVMMDENNNATTDDTDIYICGHLSVISEGTTSMLFQTPPDKAKRVTLGERIPLLKSEVAVQFLADFEVSASLGRPDNVKADCAFYFPSVKSSVLFPHSEIPESFVAMNAASRHSERYKIKRRIPGNGGYLEVRAAIDIQ